MALTARKSAAGPDNSASGISTDDHVAPDATEVTALLGAGTRRDQHGAAWEGLIDDFEGLPWWERPSVCLEVASKLIDRWLIGGRV